MKRTALPVRSTPLRRTRIRQMSGRRRAVEARRMDLKARLIALRGDRCERCQRRAVLLDMHERQTRGRGGAFTAANCSLLCRPCHEDVTAHPAAATASGWLVPSWGDPATVPVAAVDGRTWRYASDGTTEPLEAA